MRRFVKDNRPLLVLNLVLVAALAAVAWTPAADAQNAAPPSKEGRIRGDYTMVSGRVNAGGADAVYVLDAANRELIALRWDSAKQSLTGVGYRDLDADGRSSPGR